VAARRIGINVGTESVVRKSVTRLPHRDKRDGSRRVTTPIDGVLHGAAPPRETWPEPLPQTGEGRLLTEVIMTTFRLNGRLLEVAQRLAAEGGITAAWWQVLGGTLDQPRTVAEIGRRMGLTRQAVQRNADLLVDRGLAEYRRNPNHRRANLLACTEAGYWAIRRIALAQHPWANRIGAEVGAADLEHALTTMQRLVAALAC
jgi:DNA-binding MarR family transcriptional regulator